MEPMLTSIDAISRECEGILEAMAEEPLQEHYSRLEVSPYLFFKTEKKNKLRPFGTLSSVRSMFPP